MRLDYRRRPLCASVALLFCLFASASAQAGAIYADPLGDQFGATPFFDISSLTSQVTNTEVTLVVNFDEEISAPSQNKSNSVGGIIFLDTDQKASTGVPSSLHVPGPSGLGVEFYIDTRGEKNHPGLAELYRDSLPTSLRLAFVPIVYSLNSLFVTVPLALLAGDDGNMNYATWMGSASAVSDYAPNGGAPVPSTSIPEPSSLVLLALAGLALPVWRRMNRRR